MKKFWRQWLLVITVVSLGLVFLLTFNTLGDEAHMSISFDQSQWKNEEQITEEPYIRLQMIKDVMDNHLSRGLSRDQVIAKLGQPTETPYFRDYDLVYWLGAEPGLISIDSKWLVIKLDSQNAVADYKLVTD